MHVHEARVAPRLVAPHARQQIVAREDAARLGGQGLEELELGRRERQRAVAADRRARSCVFDRELRSGAGVSGQLAERKASAATATNLRRHVGGPQQAFFREILRVDVADRPLVNDA